jgi:hypothetical protein
LVFRLSPLAAICFLASLATFFSYTPAQAQYVYLDANGDGIWTSADQLNANGTPTTVDAWIDTNHNKGGGLATCDTGDGDLGFWNSYAVNLQASNGTVTFSNYINQQPTFDLTCVGVGVDFASNSTEMTTCRATPTSEPGGLKKMFTVTVTGLTGGPTLNYLPLGNLSPNFTSFGTPCSGNDFDNTYKLGSDFSDHDGLGGTGQVGFIPIISSPATVTGTENSPVSVAASAFDPDAGQLVTLTQTNDAPFLTGPASAGPGTNPLLTLTGTPDLTQGGTYTIHWTATDNAAVPLSQVATTSLVIGNVNRAPIVSAPPSVSGAENTLITVNLAASDPDGDAIFSLSGNPLPGGSTWTTNGAHTSGTLSWTPNLTQAGSYGITWTATDAGGAIGTAHTTITVTESDRQPVVTAPASTSGNANTLISFTVSALDPDGASIASLTCSSPATTGSSFTTDASNASGTFSWTPSTAQAGTYHATFTAQNTLSGSAATSITVRTNLGSLVIQAPPSVTWLENTYVEFTVTASDPDADPIAVLTTSGALPPGASFTVGGDHTSGTFRWAPSNGQAGNYVLTFIASNTEPFVPETAVTATTLLRVLSAQSGVNVVGNPSFESSTAGWGGLDGGTIARVPGGHNSDWSLEVRGPSTGTGKFSVNDTPNWVVSTPGAGALYRFSAWVRSETGGGMAQIRVREYSASKVLLRTSYSTGMTLNSGWQQLILVCTSVASGSTLDLQIMDAPKTSGEVFQADDVAVTALSTGSPTVLAQQGLQARMSPNPLNPEAILAFTTETSGPVRIQIFSPMGRLVRTLLDERDLPPTRHAIRFDGKDGSGQRLASGVYFYRIETGGMNEAGRFSVLK